MENRIMTFGEFNSLYESYGFINEAETLFDPSNPAANGDKLARIFSTAGATNEEGELDAFKAIMKGEKGARVTEIQNYLGITPADGVFGPGTEAKVKAFQKDNKLTVDGRVGVQTLRSIMSLKGDVTDTKKQDELITKTFIVKTKEQATSEGLDPMLLLVFDRVVVTKTGNKTYIICYPKADAAKTVKELDGKGLLKANWEWMKKAAEAVGKALLYTATGLFILAVDAANAIISGVISAGAFVGKAVCSAVGAAWQGLAQIADWAIKGAKTAYTKVVTWGNSAWANFYTEAARVCKGTITACVAFIDGIKNGAKTLAYTLTGLAIATWKGIKTTFGPTVKSIVEAAKDGAAFVKAGMVSIAKSVQNGAEVFRKTMKAGWDAAVKGTNVAIQAGKKYIGDTEKALVDAYNNASKSIKNGFNYLYNLGKAFWESEECEFFFGDDTIFEDLDWSMDYNSDYDSDYVEFVY